MVEGFGCPPVLFFRVSRQIQAHHRDAAQIHACGQGAGLVLDQFGGAALTHQQGLGLEALHGVGDRALDQLGGVTAEIAGLEGGVGDGRAAITPLDHREQQVGVGVALRRVQHIVHPFHRGGDAHRTDVGRAFVGPERQFHGVERGNRERGKAGKARRRSVAVG